MNLPKAFEDKMKDLLGEKEYDAYLQSYKEPKYQGLRINTLKVNQEKWQQLNPFEDLEKVPWCEEGWYYTQSKPTKHPYYYSGVYYIQEPSAMAPASYLPIAKGDKVLDLCAAPGGKSTQIAAKLSNTGLLVSNDISTGRTTALHKNMVLFGAKNALITNESPERLAKQWGSFFDKIIIDAPCSGEGMFRKDDAAIKSWQTHGLAYCMPIQKQILQAADELLKPGGMMMYATCTFSPEENEGMINWFLTTYPHYRVIPLEGVGGIAEGKPEWVDADEQLKGALRLWPHKLKGEGHFVCLLQKNNHVQAIERASKDTLEVIEEIPQLVEFLKQYTSIDTKQQVMRVKDKLYLVPEGAPSTNGLRVIRSGLQLGVLKNKRFEPDVGLCLAYPREMFKNTITLTEEEAVKYLKGETLIKDAEKGYYVVCLGDFPLGWVKAHNGLLKNQYPPSWRMMG